MSTEPINAHRIGCAVMYELSGCDCDAPDMVRRLAAEVERLRARVASLVSDRTGGAS